MSKLILRPFLKGLSVLAPIGVVAYILYYLVIGTEKTVKSVLTHILPPNYYQPGFGIIALFIGVFLVGLLMYPWITRKLIQSIDLLLRRIPLIGTVYSSIRDMMDLIGGDIKEKLGQPVMVRISETGLETLGFLTREDTSGLPRGLVAENHVVVYLQMSYQIGGYCCIVHKDQIRPVDMNVEQGLQWVLTAGVSGYRKQK